MSGRTGVADYHKTWQHDAEPELRRIVKQRDARIAELEARVKELEDAAAPVQEKPAAVAVFGRGKR